MRRADLLIGLGLLVFAALYFRESFHIVRGFASDRLGPAFFPRLLAGALATLAIDLVARAVSGRSDPAPPPPVRAATLAGVIGVTALYVLVLPRVGFLLGTPPLLGAVIWLMGLRDWRGLLGTAVGATLVLYFVFGRFLHVLLPPGLLGGR